MKIFPYPYLRLSLTDRCCFNCFYCDPNRRRSFLSEDELLSRDELLSLVDVFASYGVRHVRLTGGEPLLRRDFKEIVEKLSLCSAIERLSLTTNGAHLASFLPVLKANRIKSINVSLDTLDKDRFIRWTGVDAFFEVREAIVRARSLGVKEVKLNVLLIRGLNDDEIIDFVDFSSSSGLDVRFIEYFPTRLRVDEFSSRFIPSREVLGVIEKRFGGLEPLARDPLSGPARYFSIKGRPGRIGFISSVTDDFCGECNRLRLTADGKLYACLRSEYHADLKTVLRESGDGAVRVVLEEFFDQKRSHTKTTCNRFFEMSSIGG